MSEHEKAGHGIHIGVVLAALGTLAAVTLLVAIVAHALTALWDTPVSGPNAAMDVRIPGPNLESAPQYESARSVAADERLLSRYEWIDRDRGIARIPIESAMRILAGEAPARSAQGGNPASGTRRTDNESAIHSQPREDASERSKSEQPVAAKPIAMAEVAPHPGATLPLDTRFTDEAGREGPLKGYFGKGPVVLVFGYYRCPNLCSTLMENVLVSLSAASVPSASYEIVAVSVDPREDADDAAARARLYGVAYASLPLHLLTGSASESRRLARTAGVHYAYDNASDQYAHPLALLVAAPDGRISRYFAGVQFDPQALRLALVEAGEGRMGALTDRIFLRCAHFDPQTGRYTLAAMSFVRGGSLLFACGVGVWLWRRRKSGSPPAGTAGESRTRLE